MSNQRDALRYRPLTTADIGSVPLQHQGAEDDVRARIAACGSAAMLVFDGDLCVGQLQFRPYVPGSVSPNGLHDPLYWMDFGGRTPPLPERTLALFCYHVGQLDESDARDPRYLGRGIGTRLLDETLAWAGGAAFAAVVAKGLTPLWPVVQYMGGMPDAVYTSRGFHAAARYHDRDLRVALDEMLAGRYGEERRAGLRALVDQGADLDAAAGVTVCVRALPL